MLSAAVTNQSGFDNICGSPVFSPVSETGLHVNTVAKTLQFGHTSSTETHLIPWYKKPEDNTLAD